MSTTHKFPLQFWPEDIDVELCDVIYYGFGNILNNTFEVCSWDPWFDMDMQLDSQDLSIMNCIQVREHVIQINLITDLEFVARAIDDTTYYRIVNQTSKNISN